MRCLVLLATLWAVVGCTARYRELLQSREREIAGLKDALGRSEAELRVLQTAGDALKERVRSLERELARARAAARGRAGASPRAPRKDALREALAGVAARHGLRVEERPEGPALVLPARVTFAPGSARLNASGRRALDAAARVLRPLEGKYLLSIEGHTDAAPIRKSRFGTNWRLSAERAEAVRAYLRRRGVGRRGTVRVVGYGPSRPVSRNDREKGRRRNRRVEIVLVRLPGATPAP